MSSKLPMKVLSALFLAGLALSAVLPAGPAARAQTGDRECPTRCIRQLTAVFDECVAGGGDPLACAQKAQEALAKCLKECQPKPTPKPGADNCESRCKEKSNAALKACLEKGGGADACEKEAKDVFTNCMKECTPATKQPSCRGACEQKRVAAIKACMEKGGSEEQCKLEAEPAYQDCLKACPTEAPKPTALTCEGKCSQRSQEVYNKCIKDGGSEAECKEKAALALSECLKSCEPRATKVPSCGSLCEQEAQAHYKKCIADGGSEADCKAAMTAELEACRAKCPTSTPKPTEKPRSTDNPKPTEQSCAARCENKAKEVYDKCIKDGGTEAECQARRKSTLDECLGGCDRPKPTPTPTCRGLCEIEAKEVYNKCRAEGGGEDKCEADRKAAFEACAAKCPTSTPKPTEKPRSTEQPNCQDGCLSKAKTVFATCRTSTDKTIEQCWAQAVAALSECMRTCPANSEASCQGSCSRLREPVIKLCKSIDGVESCEDRAAKAVDECLKSCPTPTPRTYSRGSADR